MLVLFSFLMTFERFDQQIQSTLEAWRIKAPHSSIDLVGVHIAQAVYYPDLAEANIKGKTNSVYDHRYDRTVIEGMRTCVGKIKARRRVAEGMHIYVNQIPKPVDFMKEKGFGNAMLVRETWWALILRAMCWHRSLAFLEIPQGNMGPANYHGRRILVYIA